MDLSQNGTINAPASNLQLNPGVILKYSFICSHCYSVRPGSKQDRITSNVLGTRCGSQRRWCSIQPCALPHTSCPDLACVVCERFMVAAVQSSAACSRRLFWSGETLSGLRMHPLQTRHHTLQSEPTPADECRFVH